MCDKKNSVLFNDTECIVLSPNFKLTDESHVLLKVPRKNIMYCADLKNIVPKGGLTCLFAKATSDESKLWHWRLGHINFKTMNKLVKGNLVRGLPLKLFENDQTCVACQKGKQHRASCKSKIVSSISQPLHMLHMDLFGPTFVKSLMKKMYCLVVTDDYSRFSWVFFLATKDETSGILKSFITGVKNLIYQRVKAEAVNTACYVQNKVLVTMPHNKSPYEIFLGRKPALGFMRPFGCPVTILNTIDHLGKFDGKADEGFFVGYKSMYDAGTTSMETIPGKDYILLLLWNADPPFSQSLKSSPDAGFKPSRDDEKKVTKEPRKEGGDSINAASINEVNAVGVKISIELPDDPNIPELEDIVYSDDDEDVGAEANMNNLDAFMPQRTNHKDFQNCLFACFLSQEEPKKVYHALKDPRWVEAMQEELLQFKLQEVWTLVELVAQGYTQEEWIDYDEVFAPVARIKEIKLFLAYALFKDFMVYQIDFKSAFLYCKIEEEVYVCQPSGFEDPDFPDRVPERKNRQDFVYQKGLKTASKAEEGWIFISQDKYVSKILKKFSFTDVKTANTPMETQKPLIKDEDGEEVDVYLYRSMIGSLMYLTSLRPDIMFAVCACARYQVNPKILHLYAVKRIFRYLKGQSKLGLWYPKDSPFDLVAYTDSDYAGASLDMKSTTRGCQFLGSRLISWQCKKQTVVANSTIEVEYVAALSCCGQAKTINREVQLQALVDRKKIIVTKASIRSDLQLNDEEGMDCLPNATIFEELTRMGAKTTAWNKFSSTMASAIICLATNQKFKFSKYIFESMVKNLDNAGKFLMYPRFVQVFLDKQLEGMQSHKRIYVTPSHTKKIFGNMRRGEGLEMPTDPQHTPTNIQPSISQPKKKQKPRKPKRKDTEVTQPSGPTTNVADKAVYKEMDDSLERVSTTATSLDAKQDRGNINKTQSKAKPNEPSSPGTSSGSSPRCQETTGDTIAQTRSENVSKLSNDPLLARGNTLRSGEDRLKLQELMELCTNLQNRVLNMENTKTAQAQEITSLKLRVKKLEKKGGSRTHKGRKIDDLDKYAEIILVHETQERYGNEEMFDTNVLDGDEGKANVIEELSESITTTPTLITTTTATTITTISTRPRAKGLVIHEEEQATTPTVSSLQLSQLKVQDKGKGKMEEPEKHMKKKELIRLDKEIASKLQAEFDEEV
ncbi:putative ribonuclease H-like domain-containing protein [Tanacetum coccineum]